MDEQNKTLDDETTTDSLTPQDLTPDADKQDVLNEDDNGANPSSTDGGELATAAKPPEDEPQAVPATPENGLGASDGNEAAHAGEDVVPTPEPAPAEVPEAQGSEAAEPAADSGVEGNDESDAEQAGAATDFASSAPMDEPADEADAGKSDASSTSSSESQPEGSSTEEASTEPQMPALAEVHPEAKPIAQAAGDETMGKFKDAGNLMTEGLASLRGIEEQLESLGEEAKARLAHLRHKASEALAALEAWFIRE